MNDGNKKDKDKEKEESSINDVLPTNDRYFLYFEIFTILVFIPVIISQTYLAVDYFLYIVSQVDLYHYYLVTQQITTNNVNTDYFPFDESTFVLDYENSFKTLCPNGYAYDRLLITEIINNADPIDITDQLNITDPDFPNLMLNPAIRHYKFYKFDISNPPLNESLFTTIKMKTGIVFNFWKGQRYCRKKVFSDIKFNLLNVIDGNLNCTQEFPGYFADDCGSYFNNTYRLCGLRDFAYDLELNPYSANETLLFSKDNFNNNICPITKLIFKKDADGKGTISYRTRNEPDQVTGKQDDMYFVVKTDWVSFQGRVGHLPSNYSMSTYNEARTININSSLNFGWMDEMSIVLDDDDYLNFFNYQMNINFYYKGFMEDVNGNFYQPYVTQPVKAIFALYVLMAFKPECYINVYKARNERKVLGLAGDLDVSDLFMFVLTLMVWSMASIFIGLYSGLNLRLKTILMKLRGALNLNNKKSEEITKFTNKLFWFLVFIIKFGTLLQMYIITVNQISIADDFIKYHCYLESLTNTLKDFREFLFICEAKCINQLIFLVVEFAFEILVCIGYIFILIQNKKKELINRLLIEKMERDNDEVSRLHAD